MPENAGDTKNIGPITEEIARITGAADKELYTFCECLKNELSIEGSPKWTTFLSAIYPHNLESVSDHALQYAMTDRTKPHPFMQIVVDLAKTLCTKNGLADGGAGFELD